MSKNQLIIVLSISLIVSIVFFSLIYSRNVSLTRANQNLENQIGVAQREITNSIRRAETKTASRSELQKFAEESRLDVQEIKEDLNKLGAALDAVASTIAQTKSINRENLPSSNTTPTQAEPERCPENNKLIDIHQYTKNRQHRQLNDENEMRVADVTFDASNENPWSYRVYGITYTINSALSEDRQGRMILHSELLAENSEVEPGRHFRIRSVESNLLQVENKPEFNLWDPAVYLSISSGINAWPEVEFSAAMNLNFSVMSYGTWRFIGLGAGFDGVNNTFQASFFPFSYNIAEHMPVVTNIHLFPYISVNHRSTVGAGIGIGVRL